MRTIVKSATTGIGSLPHPSIDSALEFSFRMGIPFLPQIPLRHSHERMIPQALEKLPGLQLDPEANAFLDLECWEQNHQNLNIQLAQAFSTDENSSEALEFFEPSPSASSCWQPFLWELENRRISKAKVQIAGPLTAQWALKISGLTSSNPVDAEKLSEISTQIFKLVMAQSLAMCQRLTGLGIKPVIYLDEPGLFCLLPSLRKHGVGLQELKLLIQALRKQGAEVGLHCCSDTDWAEVFGLGLDIVSLDTHLSLRTALEVQQGKFVSDFIQSGGTLSLGLIPTDRGTDFSNLKAKDLVDDMMATLHSVWGPPSDLIHKTLNSSIFTPACGLAFQSTSNAEAVLELLMEAYEYFHTK